MELTREEQLLQKANEKEDVWAYAFSMANSKNGRRLSFLPVCKGIVEDNGGWIYFTPYSQKTGKLLQSKKRCVSYYNDGHFFDNEKEAVDSYNECIEERIHELKKQIDKLKSEMV